ncbi:SGNH/GDSL hydrolase family protein [Rhodococcus sp. D2-41]|uniref:SGNH/GDSL hydrolase family protein n=1 Tax=Speluncibacter jeojiensis TaxID=2710754 RepID=A0A9X4RGS7_9ACTN|nr:SGNH/GDSL hydrolase family protein [Rhodococcus sp. D2-41]MDG3010599.1 SGNH/GDSL hydrolase family protein [Rhodococcus sp. D2-41]MDG3014346.1 SGNH/GDSL hydrolase family protein [Corynebacteriales bacterium D3-21]
MSAVLRAATALAAAATVGLLTVGTSQAAPPPQKYVALGDSYASAAGVMPLVPGAPLPCSRSQRNYAHLVAQAKGVDLTDVTCGGAKVSDLTGSQFPGVAPQFDALTPDTGVVTLQIGGNDGNLFGGSVADCLAATFADRTAMTEGAAGGGGAPCRDRYGDTFLRQVAADGPRIGAAIEQIHQRSPRAKMFVVGYLGILPRQGNCFAQIPLAVDDVAYLNELELALNSMIRTEAASHGATFVDTPDAGHDACAPEGVRWVEPLIPGTDAVSLHPNATGEAAVARQVEAALGRA